jgi:O-antigen ligase
MPSASSAPRKPTPRPPVSRFDAGLAPWVGLCALLVWIPVPLGSNRPWAVGFMAMVLWALVVATQWGRLRGPQAGQWPSAWSRAWLPLSLLAGLAVLALAQLWMEGATADPARTREHAIRTLAYLAAFALTVLVGHTAARRQGVLMAIVAAGVCQALLAVVLYSSRASYDFLFTDFSQGGRAMGTFPNPDHLAGYMELCLSAGLGLLLAQFGGEAQARRAGWQHALQATLDFMLSTKMLLRLMLVLMVIALVMTHSRMGNGAFFLSILLLGGLIAVLSRKLRRPALWLVASMALIDVVIIGQWVGLDRVVARLQGTAVASGEAVASFGLGGQASAAPGEESIAERLTVPRLALALVAEKPWLGHGGGSFYTVFPPHKIEGFPWHWDHAHNDYVEVASDMGLVGLALWVGLGLATGLRAARLLRDDQPRLHRGIGAAALMALLTLGLHSMVDFNLQIPANALTLTVLLALAWSVPLSKASASRAPQSSSIETT